MILTITLNPLLEKNLYFKKMSSGNNRAYKQNYSAGGKGINISRQLNLLGIKNHSFIFLGGANGKKLRAKLEEEQIHFSVVSTKDETREATLVFDEQKDELTTYFAPNSQITQTEIERFSSKLEKAILNATTVIFSGSTQSVEVSKIIVKGIELCHKHDKISVLDTYGPNYAELIEQSPTILHNNIEELQTSLGLSLSTEKEKLELLDNFYEKNIKLAFITDGKEVTYASKSDFHYKITNSNIAEKNATGSGDAFLSGLIYGLEKSMVFNDFTKLASAFGTANAASWDVC
ncbi:MAG: 1-phosphofructokinase, partial [Ignavibacteriae bacterium]|nr:1-phosphofructokinase [Ignavibacteriota bacterium]